MRPKMKPAEFRVGDVLITKTGVRRRIEHVDGKGFSLGMTLRTGRWYYASARPAVMCDPVYAGDLDCRRSCDHCGEDITSGPVLDDGLDWRRWA